MSSIFERSLGSWLGADGARESDRDRRCWPSNGMTKQDCLFSSVFYTLAQDYYTLCLTELVIIAVLITTTVS